MDYRIVLLKTDGEKDWVEYPEFIEANDKEAVSKFEAFKTVCEKIDWLRPEFVSCRAVKLLKIVQREVIIQLIHSE